MREPVAEFLDSLRQQARTPAEQGLQFEKVVQACLSRAPTYRRRYEKVWRWSQWAREQGIDRTDTGIDLVARTRDGRYCAIQCKFFQPGHVLQKGEIASFLAAANEHWGQDGKIAFSEMILVSTSTQLSSHAENSLRKQRVRGIYLGFEQLWAELPADVRDEMVRDRSCKGLDDRVHKTAHKKLRPHQEDALKDVLTGFKNRARGQLIMACGTGKTLLSIKIAEKILHGKGGNVLFLAPSLALISQTLHEWSAEFIPQALFFAVCSDAKVGREAEDIAVHELAIPATTDSRQLAEQLTASRTNGKQPINVVFATYHSIEVVSEAQKRGAPDFALVICDEAHRTTGVEQPPEANDGEQKKPSYFLQVHDQNLLRADKRLYMTATPRIYTESAKKRGQEKQAKMFSMDETEVYGEEFHRLDFSTAVQKGLLSDYKVLILGVDEKKVSEDMQEVFTGNGEIGLEDAHKIIGCWNGLAKRIRNAVEGGILDKEPMRRAVAFSQTIAASKHTQKYFSAIVNEYQRKYPEKKGLSCEIRHVDGKQGAAERSEHLRWLRTDPGPDTCRILSNVRCLSEGVDVPALDAVLFLNPRRSMVDIVQSVGRVMRKAKGKKCGYIILPVAVPTDMAPHEVLDQHDNRYTVVWQVLRALRSHDDRLNVKINRLGMKLKGNDEPDIIIDIDELEEEEGPYNAEETKKKLEQGLLNFDVGEWKNAIFARMVLKCGDRRYWEAWAKDVAKIAQRSSTRIRALVRGSNATYRELFAEFLTELRQNLNPEVSEEDAIEMLSQHLITRPVFEALFENYGFAKKNPISNTMQAMLELLDAQNLGTEIRGLKGFYASVRQRVSGIDDAGERQKIIVELYEKFFSAAFSKMAERLGIVYTPIEVVDFILHSVDWLLQKEFGKGIGAAGVNVLDPFAGTGTFMSRLLQSSLIADKDLERKFQNELHANELVLLAYYIAAINIEEAYHDRKRQIAQKRKGKTAIQQQEDIDYEPFEGIVLTDTFQINERDGDMLDKIFPVNSKRVQKQKGTPIRVVLGNPPYSVGQRSQNDANWNLKYPKLDESIRNSYALHSSATLKNSLYDSYIRAFRWASDRIGEEGVVAYISNGGWLDGNATDGFRKCLQEEFSSIYCFNLRGNQRTSGELSRREGGKIFGSGSRASITLLFLIKNPKAIGDCQIHYHDIGDYLDRTQKLAIIREAGSAEKIPWCAITPNAEHDWINQRNPEFINWLPMGDKANKKEQDMQVMSISKLYSRGVVTHRDAWAYNFSREIVSSNMRKTIDFYNNEVKRYQKACAEKSKGEKPKVDGFINYDSTKIHWDVLNIVDLQEARQSKFSLDYLRISHYRPFCKQWLYFDSRWNARRYQQPYIFPTSDHENHIICVSGPGANKEFSVLMVDTLPDLGIVSASQCFPRYRYEQVEEGTLYGGDKGWRQVDNIPSETVSLFREHYGDQRIDGDAIFYYVYGVLHSPAYKERFAADLKKMLPRIPYAKTLADFRAFSKAGRQLADLHTDYESLKPYPLDIREQHPEGDLPKRYQVGKMRFGGAPRKPDKSVIRYNENLTIEGVPLDAYDYIINGKSAVEWVMERYQITTHKDSGIKNDPNQWSDDPRYIVDLLGKVVRLSLDTLKIISTLPKLF